MNIWYGTKENSVLSNLALRPFVGKDNREYATVEHAYQSWKSGKFNMAIYSKPWKAGSKFVAKGTKTDGNWNIQLMYAVVLRSFAQNADAKNLLLSTKGSTLTHTQDTGVWRTKFPEILMQVRGLL